MGRRAPVCAPATPPAPTSIRERERLRVDRLGKMTGATQKYAKQQKWSAKKSGPKVWTMPVRQRVVWACGSQPA
eukprot:scaffold605_cov400-Prasinococcus_capsulatus_cf.AAC.9